MAESDLSRAFVSLGVELVESPGNQLVGECPFCQKPKHFYVRPGGSSDKGGHWHCKHCDERGNVYSFLSKLIDDSCSLTTSDDYKELWKAKKLSPASAKLCRVCKSSITDEWLFPSCKLNREGNLSVTYVHRWNSETNILKGISGLPVSIIGQHLLNEQKPENLLFGEGHWDFGIKTHILRTTKRHREFDALATPGAGSFKPNWLPLFQGYKRIFLVFDADHDRTTKTGRITNPGRDGMFKVFNALKEDGNKAEINCIKWPEGLKSGYDVRDLFIDKLKG